jgi:hypothetical protein
MGVPGMRFIDYVVPFVGLAYFVGGYVVGRCHTRRMAWGTSVDPDPIALRDEEEPAKVVSLVDARVGKERDQAAV